MKKRIVVCLVLVTLFFVAGCGGIFPTGCIPSCGGTQLTDKEYAIQMQEKVVAVLMTRDKAALKALFTEDAVNSVAEKGTSIDVQIDNFFDWFQGEITEWKFDDTGAVYDSFGKERVKTIRSACFVYVDGKEHTFVFLDCPINSSAPQNVGLYMFLAVKSEGEQWTWWPVEPVGKDVSGVYFYQPEVEVE